MTAIIILGGIILLIKMFCSACQHTADRVARAVRTERSERILEQPEQTRPDHIALIEADAAMRSAMIEQTQTEKQRKAEAAQRQAAADEAFYIEQIDKLYAMLWDADEDLERARTICQHDNEQNRAGAVVSDKVVGKHRAERDRLSKRVMQLERSIHAYETKLNKCRFILAN